MTLLDGRFANKAKTGIILFSVVSVLVTFYSSVLMENLPSFQYPKLPPEQCPRQQEGCQKRVFLQNRARKWIALWISSETKADVTHFTNIPGWKTVVVGDGLCPIGCRFPDCVFLDVQSQSLVAPSMTSLLPADHPSRKNLAYLYAIRQHAYFIYDTDINVRANLSSFYYGDVTGLVFAGKGVFNYYKHYGEHWARPPGFVDIGMQDYDLPQYVLKYIPHPEVQHALVKVKDGAPRFQSITPPVFVGASSFAPFVGRNTLFRRQTFLGLLTFPIPGGDVIRSYILQALLKQINGFVGILPPTGDVTGHNSNHTPTYNIRKSLVLYLHQWKCTGKRSVGSCLLELATDLLREGLISARMVKIVFGWMKDSIIAGYHEVDFKMDDQSHSLFQYRNTSTPPGVMYYNNPQSKAEDAVTTFCNNFTYPNTTRNKFRNILLIITFNYVSLYQNIQYVEAIYRHYFPNMLFCGPNIEAFRKATSHLPKNGSVFYVSGLNNTWKYFQECTVFAMKINLKLEGYLQIGDDTLLNPWNLWNLPSDQIWFDHQMFQLSRYKTYRWAWWSRPVGKTALKKVFAHIERFVGKPEPSMEKKFYFQYVKNVGNFIDAFRQRCDFFYIPARLQHSFIYMTNIFINSSLIVEVSLPTMILGLDEKEKITRVKGVLVSRGMMDKPKTYFDPKAGHFVHPFKGINLMKRPSCITFLCKTYLPMLVRRMESYNIKNSTFNGVSAVIPSS